MISGTAQASIPTIFTTDTTTIPGTMILNVLTSDPTTNGAYNFVIKGTIFSG
jgi:hypothetical protein